MTNTPAPDQNSPTPTPDEPGKAPTPPNDPSSVTRDDSAGTPIPPQKTTTLYPANFPQPVYAQPVYVTAPPAPPRGKSIASMVLGIVAVFFGYTLIVPIVGLCLGVAGLRTEPAGRGMAMTGTILSSIMLAGWGLVVIFFVTFGIIGLGAAATSGTTGTY